MTGTTAGDHMLKFSLSSRHFTLRDLTPRDLEPYQRFFNELSEESVRCRFGHLLTKLTLSAAEQRLHVDPESEKAVAVFDVPENRILAIGRCCLDARTGDAEVALVVAEDARRLGLGRFLLRQLVGIARRESGGSVSAHIATRNAPVIRLLQSEGFTTRPATPGEDVQLVLALTAPV